MWPTGQLKLTRPCRRDVVPALSRSRPFLAAPRVLANNFFVEFTKLIVWRRPIFSWLYAQLVDHSTISCLTCNSSRELSFSPSFSLHLSFRSANHLLNSYTRMTNARNQEQRKTFQKISNQDLEKWFYKAALAFLRILPAKILFDEQRRNPRRDPRWVRCR